MSLNRDYAIAYGLHSNIPPCCIVFFLTDWERETANDAPYARAVHAAPEYNYVPCPECFAFRRVNRLRECDKDCPSGYAHCREQYRGDTVNEDTRRLVLQFRVTMGV